MKTEKTNDEKRNHDIQWDVIKSDRDGFGVISAGIDHENRIVIHSLGARMEGKELEGGWCIRLGEGEEDLLRTVIEALYEKHGWTYPG